MKIILKDEFKAINPPLNSDELEKLKNNIIREGCRDPLVVWEREGEFTLIDGYNRHQICQKHNIPYKIKRLKFDTVADVRIWIRQNQLGRRNLTDRERRIALGALYQETIQAHGGDRRSERYKSSGQSGQSKRHDLANHLHTGDRTLRRNRNLFTAINKLENEKHITGDFLSKIRREDIEASDDTIIHFSKQSPDVQVSVQKVINGGTTNNIKTGMEIVLKKDTPIKENKLSFSFSDLPQEAITLFSDVWKKSYIKSKFSRHLEKIYQLNAELANVRTEQDFKRIENEILADNSLEIMHKVFGKLIAKIQKNNKSDFYEYLFIDFSTEDDLFNADKITGSYGQMTNALWREGKRWREIATDFIVF